MFHSLKMIRQPLRNEKQNANATPSMVEKGQQNIVLGRYSDKDMIVQLKRLALDPCDLQFSSSNIRTLLNQILELRTVMVPENSAIPWRKRKHEQFIKDKLKAPCDLVSSDPQNITKLKRGRSSYSSSASCLLNSVGSTQFNDAKITFGSRDSSSLLADVLLEKQVSSECSLPHDVVHQDNPTINTSSKVHLDGSTDGKKLLTPENRASMKSPSVENTNTFWSTNSVESSNTHRTHLKPPNDSKLLPDFIDVQIQRKVIPYGPRFQAEVPEWNGLADRRAVIDAYSSDSNNLRWLGTRVWPNDGKNKAIRTPIGKGRPNSCCCQFPGSADCVGHHIHEKRLLLQRHLGTAFSIWKFDEMGEQFSKLWSVKEQQKFVTLLQRSSSSSMEDWMKQACKCFRFKHRKDIVGYYFNVYIPHRMSLKRVDSDDEEEVENASNVDLQKRSRGRNPDIRNPKDVKARYLRGA